MKVYVCYCDLGYDGMTEPAFVFSNERDAKIWLETQGGDGRYREFKILDKFVLHDEVGDKST